MSQTGTKIGTRVFVNSDPGPSSTSTSTTAMLQSIPTQLGLPSEPLLEIMESHESVRSYSETHVTSSPPTPFMHLNLTSPNPLDQSESNLELVDNPEQNTNTSQTCTLPIGSEDGLEIDSIESSGYQSSYSPAAPSPPTLASVAFANLHEIPPYVPPESDPYHPPFYNYRPIEPPYPDYSAINYLRSIEGSSDLFFVTGSPQTQQHRLSAHKAVMTQVPYIKRYIQHGYAVAGDRTPSQFQLSHVIIRVPEFTPEALNIIITYVYTSNLKIHPDSFAEVLKIAKKFKISNEINFWKIHKHSLTHDTTSLLYQTLHQYLKRNLKHIRRDPEYLELDFLDVVALLRQASDDCPSTDTSAMTSLLRWIKQKPISEHNKYLAAFQDKFQQQPIGEQFKQNSKLTNHASLSHDESKKHKSDFYHSPGKRSKLDLEHSQSTTFPTLDSELIAPFNVKFQMKKCHVMIERFDQQSLTKTIKTHKKFHALTQPCLLYPVVDSEIRTKYLEAFSFETNKCYKLHRLQRPREYSTLVPYENVIYEIGGSKYDPTTRPSVKLRSIFSPFDISRDVDVFCVGNWSSEEGRPASMPKILISSVLVGDYIYVTGGSDLVDNQSVDTNNVERYCISQNKWEPLPYLECPRSLHDSVVVGNLLYICGGIGAIPPIIDGQETQPLSSVECLNLKTLELIPIDSMLTPRMAHRVFYHNSKIYVIGGTCHRSEDQNGTLKSVEVYDPASKKWSQAAPMHYPRKNFGILKLDDKVYVIGGNSTIPARQTIEIYYPEDDKWVLLKEWPKELSSFGQFQVSTTISAGYVNNHRRNLRFVW